MLRLTDHRGRQQTLPPEALASEAFRRAHSRFRTTQLTLIGIAALSLQMGLEFLLQQLGASAAWSRGSAFAPSLLAAFLLDRALADRWWWYGPEVVRDHLRLALAQGRCPLCAYDLQGTPPETDHCHPCPECGAAWRLPARPTP